VTGTDGATDQLRIHRAWIVLAAVTLVLLAASGVRSAFGVFIKPLEAEFGWDRTSLAAVASLSLLLNGAIGPVVGRLADRWGPRGILAAASVLVGAGTLGTATVVALWQLYLTAGVITALGAGGAASVSIAAVVAARWFDSRRGLVIGIAGGGLAAGQLLIVPLAMGLTLTWGWRLTFVALGAGFLALIVPIVLTLVRNDPRDVGLQPYGAVAGDISAGAGAAPVRTSLREAVESRPFWLLAGSFWVCGYTSSGLVLTHLIPHATEHGFHATQAAQALGVMGALNIVGTVASGWICDRFGLKGPLAGYYLLRGLSLLLLPYVGTVPGLFAFAAIFGLNYISTVPATTALTAKIYGRYSVGELSGWIFFSHQIGSAAGSLLGGYLYDRMGDYTVAFHSAAALALVATALVLAIRDQPLADRAATVLPSAAS
jgi:predicted MFS family arabinose efflux permease